MFAVIKVLKVKLSTVATQTGSEEKLVQVLDSG